MNIVLWIIQILLALLFLFGGVFKLVAPIEPMVQMTNLPGLFLRFIGLCEALGGLGLILPALLRIMPFLTPLAAALLIIITIGAIVVSLMTGPVGSAIAPLVTTLLLAFVAYGRLRLAPISPRMGGGQ